MKIAIIGLHNNIPGHQLQVLIHHILSIGHYSHYTLHTASCQDHGMFREACGYLCMPRPEYSNFDELAKCDVMLQIQSDHATVNDMRIKQIDFPLLIATFKGPRVIFGARGSKTCVDYQ